MNRAYVDLRPLEVAVVCLDFHLHGCRSLKEKRQRLGGLKDRFGRNPLLALSETAFQDTHGRARWCVVGVASDRKVVEQTLGTVIDYASQNLDAELTDVHKEWLV